MQVTVEQVRRSHEQWQCLLDGKDISSCCAAADDVEGWADIFPVFSGGGPLLPNRERKTERLYGKVELHRLYPP